MEKFMKAAQLLRNWLRNPCRFDLYDVADRGGILKEVQYLQYQLLDLLDDDINVTEMYEFFVEEQQQQAKEPISWLEYLTSIFRR